MAAIQMTRVCHGDCGDDADYCDAMIDDDNEVVVVVMVIVMVIVLVMVMMRTRASQLKCCISWKQFSLTISIAGKCSA